MMPKFLTRKRDKQKSPVRKRVIRKNTKSNGVVTRVPSVTPDSDYKLILKEKDRFTRKLTFAAFLANRLKNNGIDSVLVGGSAVEVYTNGDFPTADMDFDVSNMDKAIQLLKNLGFKKTDSLWYNGDLDIVVDLSSKGYSGDPAKLRIIKVRNYSLKVAGVEDLVVNRLYSAKFWKSNPQRDLEEATALVRIFSGKLDSDYLKMLAEKNDVIDVLSRILI
ncbi:MAG: hypothetical protein HMLIMOIP_002633 [Candidatus Nitrosomirales archaeon]|jgi:hypothetical protein